MLSCSADYLLELHDDQKIYIESTGLTLEQKAHIQQIVNDLKISNERRVKCCRQILGLQVLGTSSFGTV